MSVVGKVVFDKDLNPLLNASSNDELQLLVDLLSGTFTNTLTIEEDYKKYYPDHKKYADLIAAHIRLFGGDSFANAWRGLKRSLSGEVTITSEGPAYREIVSDVAKYLKVEFNKNNPTDELELLILKATTKKFMANLSEEQKKDLLKGMSDGTEGTIPNVLPGGIGADEFRLMFVSSHYTLLGMIGKGLPATISFCCTSTILGFISPPLLLSAISSPAYRVTVPAVIYVAILRLWQKSRQQEADW